jgi:hypothetical protein
MTTVSLLEAVIELAKEVERSDFIDFADVNFSEDSAYNLVANKVVEETMMTPKDHRELMLMATAVHLTVENFVLHQRLMRASQH